jgi:hypothetical protein
MTQWVIVVYLCSPLVAPSPSTCFFETYGITSLKRLAVGQRTCCCTQTLGRPSSGGLSAVRSELLPCESARSSDVLYVGIAMPHLIIELHGLRDAAYLTGFNITNIRPALPEIGERGVDVLFELDGRRLGAQHTIFHSDEGDTPGKRGSALRAKEESTQPPGMFGKSDYRPALLLRVEEKIAIGARHDNDELIAETWLVISANLGKRGAAASTMIAPAALRADDLNALCHSQLAGSKFECALLVLHLDSIVYGWDREGGWRLLADPGASDREQHRKEMNDLIFNQIPAHFRGACR